MLPSVAKGCGFDLGCASLLKADKKPTDSVWRLSVSRVFPVDDSARVESPTVCLDLDRAIAILISLYRDSDHRLCSPNGPF